MHISWAFMRMISFEDHINRTVHIAMVRGEIAADTPTLVRVHRQDTLGDIVGILNPKLGWPMDDALKRIAEAGTGVVVVLRHSESAREFVRALRQIDSPPAPPSTGLGSTDTSRGCRAADLHA